MKKPFVYAAGSAAALGLAAGAFYVRRRKFLNKEVTSTIEQAGVPDQVPEDSLEQLENAKMVSEGSQFGVKYYNEAKAEQEELVGQIH